MILRGTEQWFVSIGEDVMRAEHEPLDDLFDCNCLSCKGQFWVPFYEDVPEIGLPSFCPFCGCEFDWMEEA